MTQTAEVLSPVPPLPPPKELVIKETGALVAYACQKCGLMFILHPNEAVEDREEKKRQAAAHCVKTCVCGKPLDYHYYLRCKDCRTELAAAREKARFEEAEKLSIESYPDHPVYWEKGTGDMNGEGYFSSVDALLDYCEVEGLDLPEYVWSCTRKDLRLCAHDILIDALERHNMDTDGTHIPAEAENTMQSFFDAWLKEQGIHAWFTDYSRAVVLRERDSAPPTMESS